MFSLLNSLKYLRKKEYQSYTSCFIKQNKSKHFANNEYCIIIISKINNYITKKLTNQYFSLHKKTNKTLYKLLANQIQCQYIKRKCIINKCALFQERSQLSLIFKCQLKKFSACSRLYFPKKATPKYILSHTVFLLFSINTPPLNWEVYTLSKQTCLDEQNIMVVMLDDF